MRFRLLAVLATVFVLLLLVHLSVTERWTTPADELKTVLRFHRSLTTAQRAYREAHGRYANLEDLLRSGAGTSRIETECEELYCFEVRGTSTGYSIRIHPDSRADDVRRRHVSLYSDETEVIRIAFGLPHADATSDRLSAENIRRFQQR
jgi:hypothetical protein